MIDEQETYRRFGYYARDLPPQSHRKVVAICDDCKKVRVVEKKQYCNLCRACAQKGEKNHNYGKHLSEETRNKISRSLKGEKNPLFGKHHSKEARKKMSEARKIQKRKEKEAKIRRIEQIYNKKIDLLLYELYWDKHLTLIEIAKIMGIHRSTLRKWFKEYDIPVRRSLIPTFRRTPKIEQQNTGESVGCDVTNCSITSLQYPILTSIAYGHERLRYYNREEVGKKFCLVCHKELSRKQILRNQKFCSIKCFGIWFRGKKAGEKNPFYGKKHSEATKKKIGDANRNRSPPIKGHTYEEFFGEEKAKELKKNHSLAMKGRTVSDETKEKISKSIKEKCGDKIRERNKKMRGPLHPNWNGGSSRLPYSWEFRTIRKKIIERDNATCQVCHKKLSDEFCQIHHINYLKNDDREENLILLCPSCHAKTNYNRDMWIPYFKKIMIEKGVIDDECRNRH